MLSCCQAVRLPFSNISRSRENLQLQSMEITFSLHSQVLCTKYFRTNTSKSHEEYSSSIFKGMVISQTALALCQLARSVQNSTSENYITNTHLDNYRRTDSLQYIFIAASVTIGYPALYSSSKFGKLNFIF